MSDRQTVDVRGEFCPRPIIETAKAILRVAEGEELVLLATDPGVEVDMPAWCKATGHELVSLTRTGAEFEIVIRRLARP